MDLDWIRLPFHDFSKLGHDKNVFIYFFNDLLYILQNKEQNRY